VQLSYLTEEAITSFITAALQEDVGDGDHTTLSSIPVEAKETAQIILKDSGVVAGVEIAKRIFHQVSQDLSITTLVEEGTWAVTGTVVMRIAGPARAILTAERLVLNCMQRMSGIATYTRQLSDLIQGTNAKLLDTRKTTPNFRICEKWAVAIGGGVNHRYGLWDMILLKDNHIDYAGGITEAVQATQQYLHREGKDLKIEVETRTLQEVQEALEVGGVFRIMLDNMHPDTMRKAIILIDGKAQTEASGGINERTIRAVAETGVDYISVGALTHSFKSLDLSLKAVKS